MFPIYGGYAREDWSRDDANWVLFRVNSTTAALAEEITLLTVLDRIAFEASAASEPGASSYGLRASSASGSRLNHVTLIANSGADGIDGQVYSGGKRTGSQW